MGSLNGRVGGELVPLLGGVRRECDPGAIPPHMFRDLINTRLVAGMAVSRGGQSKRSTTAVSGCVTGLFPPEFRDVDRKLYYSDGFDTILSRYNDQIGARETVFLANIGQKFSYDGDLYFFGDLIPGSPNVTPVMRLRFGTSVPVLAFNINWLNNADLGPFWGGVANGKLWIIYGYHNITTPTNGRVYSWDGATLTTENSFDFATAQIIFGSGEGEFLPFGDGWIWAHRSPSTADRLMVRSGTTLSFAAWPAGASTTFGPFAFYKGKAYIPGAKTGSLAVVYSWDGAAIAEVHTLAGTTFSRFDALASFDGYLFAAYKSGASGAASLQLARFDGATWVEPHVTIAADSSGNLGPSWLIEYNGALVVVGITDAGSSIYRSQGTSTTVAWTLLTATSSESALRWPAIDTSGPMDVIVSRTPFGLGGNVGHFFFAREGSPTFVEKTFPAGVLTYERRPSETEFRKHHFLGGLPSKILGFFEEDQSLWTAGIAAPAAAPGLVAVGGGALSGNQIGFISFRHKIGRAIIQESNLSPGSATVSFNGAQQRQWTLTGSSPDARVTHVVEWVSVDGALPKEVAELPIASVGNTENTALAALGDPPPVDDEGNLKQARGIPPYARYLLKYHRRVWYGGDPTFPARWWYSELDEPESVGSLNFIEHLENETIVGGGAAGDHLLTCGASVAYVIQGWDEADFRIYKASPSIGTVSHFGMVNINEVLWLPAEIGVVTYTPGAGFHPTMDKDLQQMWRDEYEVAPDIFDNSFGGDDRGLFVYKLLLSYPTLPQSFYFVGSYRRYDANVGSGDDRPAWMFDVRDRQDFSFATFRTPARRLSAVYTGSCDGLVRRENVESNDDDDGDTFQKEMVFETPHYLPGQQAGDENQGFQFNALTMFLVSEYKPWTIAARSGDDSVAAGTLSDPDTRANPSWSETVPASRDVRGDRHLAMKTSHHFAPIPGVSGKGTGFRVNILKALRVEYRGLALEWTDDQGHQNRPLI